MVYGVTAAFAEDVMNNNGDLLREYSISNNLKITNTSFLNKIFMRILGVQEIVYY